VRLERHGDAALVIPTGELDHGAVPELKACLDRACALALPRVVLDLRELEFVDSSGLGALLTARREAGEAAKAFSLIAGHPGIGRALAIAGVVDVFTWTPAAELA
jgi:anti-sigma B factor antagonist